MKLIVGEVFAVGMEKMEGAMVVVVWVVCVEL